MIRKNSTAVSGTPAKVNKPCKPRAKRMSTSASKSTGDKQANNNSTACNSIQQLTRLDAYLPALNTGHMDGKIQDVIIKHPLVRTLIVPECDLEARRRCIGLVTRILESATPILPLLLSSQSASDSAAVNKLRQEASFAMGSSFPNGGAPLPNFELAPEARNRLLTMIVGLADRDPILRFWYNHYIDSSGSNMGKGNALTMSPVSDSQSKSGSASGNNDESTLALYLRVKSGKENLADLADRIQGAVCKAFWETWDDIFITLADIVGCGDLQTADTGRMFRPCGDAAIYINNHKVTKKREMEEQKRKSLLASHDANPHSVGSPSAAALHRSMSMPMSSFNASHLAQQPQFAMMGGHHGSQQAHHSQSTTSNLNSNGLGASFNMYNAHEFLDSSLTASSNTNSNNHRNSILSATSPLDSRHASNPLVDCFGAYEQRYPVSPPKSNGSPDSFGDDLDPLNNSHANGSGPNPNTRIPHYGGERDTSGYILPEIYHDPVLVPHRAPSSSNSSTSPNTTNGATPVSRPSTMMQPQKQQQQQQHPLHLDDHQSHNNNLHNLALNMSSTPDEQLFGSFTTLEDTHQRANRMASISSATSQSQQHVDLRQRIKMMEEGKTEEVSSDSSVVW